MDIDLAFPTPDRQYLERMAQPAATAGQTLLGANLSFKDILDVVNPLQQLPVVGDIYRLFSGDTISAGARMAGGFLMGGPVGFMMAALNAGFEAATGNDIAGTMLAMVAGDSEKQYAQAAYAKAQNLPG